MKQIRQNIQLRNTILLLIAAVVWGAAFPMQSIGANYVGPFTFLAVRSWIAFAVLIPVTYLLGRRKNKGSVGQRPHDALFSAAAVRGGAVCGSLLFAASILQQTGIAYTTSAKSSFITAMYVVIVPLLSLFLGKRPSGKIWICVIMGVAGLYLLCIRGSMSLGYGDALTLLCAVLFALQIMAVNHYVKNIDGVRLTCLSFLTEAILATVGMLLTERTASSDFLAALPSILYAGVFSSGVGYTLQAVGQTDLNPTIASLAMSMESVFGALTGWLILHQALSGRELAGCALMFGAIVLSQIPAEKLLRLPQNAAAEEDGL